MFIYIININRLFIIYESDCNISIDHLRLTNLRYTSTSLALSVYLKLPLILFKCFFGFS
jgi:hypothetical protein